MCVLIILFTSFFVFRSLFWKNELEDVEEVEEVEEKEFGNLPNEMIDYISAFCDYRSRREMSNVSVRFYKIFAPKLKQLRSLIVSSEASNSFFIEVKMDENTSVRYEYTTGRREYTQTIKNWDNRNEVLTIWTATSETARALGAKMFQKLISKYDFESVEVYFDYDHIFSNLCTLYRGSCVHYLAIPFWRRTWELAEYFQPRKFTVLNRSGLDPEDDMVEEDTIDISRFPRLRELTMFSGYVGLEQLFDSGIRKFFAASMLDGTDEIMEMLKKRFMEGTTSIEKFVVGRERGFCKSPFCRCRGGYSVLQNSKGQYAELCEVGEEIHFSHVSAKQALYNHHLPILMALVLVFSIFLSGWFFITVLLWFFTSTLPINYCW